MSNYEITIQVDMRETEQEVTQGAQHSTDGRFRIVISREAGQSIDHGEQALFAANYPAMREAITVSKPCSLPIIQPCGRRYRVTSVRCLNRRLRVIAREY